MILPRDERGRRFTRPALIATLASVTCLSMVCTAPVWAAPQRHQLPTATGLTVSAPTTSTAQAAAPSTTTSTTASDACGPLIPKAGGGYWQCTLDSTFTGSTVNRNLWVPITTAESGFHSGPECLVDSPNNISVANGVLTLTVRQESQPFTCSSPSGSYTTQYTGAELATYGTFSQQYGRFEVRAKVPSTPIPGLQESFWMWPVNDTKYGGWPLSGEIDIAEVYSEYADRAIPFIHYNNGLDSNATNDYCYINVGDWNTYDVVWTPTTIQMIYNGQTCLTDNWNPVAPQTKPAPFDQPFMMALSAVLGVSPNTFDASTTPLPATTEIQWVKAWK